MILRRIAVAVVLLAAGAAGARDFEVKLLKGKPEAGVWGTPEFEAYVSRTGAIARVKVRGKEILKQANSLYTFPIPISGKKGIRCVQGEGYGKRGMSIDAPELKLTEKAGERVFEYVHLVSNKKVMDGRPLCRIQQKIVITPTGEIHIDYDCEFLETLRWQTFMQLVIFDEKMCRDMEYVVIIGDRVMTGPLEKGPVVDRRIRSEPFDQLSVWTDEGPCHYVWHEESSCSFHWGGGIQTQFGPADVSRNKPVYKGQKVKMSYSILLPVSQE